ncbi:MAG: CDP-paratose 2-epimerase [Acidobacteria bacterium]|nr:MAG: CDP-paratose 2-epimerase [Acidobacteriota bacterium]REJ98352.1 MAG: CDP-paratose 2-epimerase [Acidobacteriota bacterium]REK17096.1 MAG: CDP-paratose 2-epimerase [Acidobacteriota bacterium]REK43006.1 MAG: CDP-paratose 2-epimerase [Acidobacteriota bacterium]
MAEHILRTEQTIDRPIEETFEFFADAGNLERITPPELNFKIITPQPIDIQKGTIIDYRLRLRGFPMSWKTVISEWNPPFSFVDEALKSPYSQWIHRHTFEEIEPGRTLIKDTVRYRLPLEPLGDLGHWFIKRELDYIFDYRNSAVEEILQPKFVPAGRAA